MLIPKPLMEHAGVGQEAAVLHGGAGGVRLGGGAEPWRAGLCSHPARDPAARGAR